METRPELPPEFHLKLTVKDLDTVHQEKVPKDLRYYHFKDTVRAEHFQKASLITFDYPDGKGQYVIKDLYSRLSRPQKT